MLLLCALIVGSGTMWADTTGTINFGSSTGYTNVNTSPKTGNDSQGIEWTVTTVGTTSFTPNSSYAQIGSGSKPATSITFTATIAATDVNVKSFSAKFGGFNNTAGTVTLKVGDTSVGSGSLNASSDVTVSSTKAQVGTTLTVTVTGISKGVKAYYISYTYAAADNTDYTITINDAVEHGSVAAQVNSSNVTTAKAGTEITLVPTPADGYKLAAWDVQDAESNTVTVTNNKFTMPSSNVTVDATFKYLNSITVNDAEHGSVSASPTTAIEGETVTLTVTPDANYQLASITAKDAGDNNVAISGTGNTRTFTMPTSAVTVTPTFEVQPGSVLKPFTVAEALEYIENDGSATTNMYVKGIISTIESAAVESSTYLNYYISDDGSTTDQLYVYKGKNLNNTAFTAVGNIAVGDNVVIVGKLTEYSSTPEFTKDNYLVSQVRNFTLTLDAMTNGSATVEVNGESQTPNGDGEVTVASGSTVTMTAVPVSGYTFAKWSSTNTSEDNSTDNPLEFTMPFDDVVIAATFVNPNVEYDIVVDDDVTGGTIEADKNTAKKDETVTLTATPAANYVFGSWDVQDESSNTITVTNNQFTMPASDVTVTATFKKVHTVNYYIGGVKNTTTRVDGTTLNLDAPSSSFAGWSTANSAASPVFVANNSTVSADMTLYAVFISGGSAPTYELVEANQADWRGDYLIAYSSTIFADGREAGTSGMGANGTQVNPGDNLTNLDKTVAASWGDTYNVSLEAIDNSDLSKGYVLVTKDGKYNYQTSNANGLASTENKETAAAYPISVTFTSSSDIKLKLGGSATGAVFRYNTGSSGYFRFYKDGGQNAVYLYKRQENYTYSLDVYEEITISSAEYKTYVNTSKALNFSGKATVYTATDKESSVGLNEVASGQIPANTPVVLYLASGGTIYVPAIAAASSVGSNDLRVVGEGGLSGEDGVYVLANKAKGVGFYLWDSTKTLNEGKIYLKAAASAREFLGFGDDETTGIKAIDNEQLTIDNYYDLSGRKVAQPTKGLYIVNGKKVVVK